MKKKIENILEIRIEISRIRKIQGKRMSIEFKRNNNNDNDEIYSSPIF